MQTVFFGAAAVFAEEIAEGFLVCDVEVGLVAEEDDAAFGDDDC